MVFHSQLKVTLVTQCLAENQALQIQMDRLDPFTTVCTSANTTNNHHFFFQISTESAYSSFTNQSFNASINNSSSSMLYPAHKSKKIPSVQSFHSFSSLHSLYFSDLPLTQKNKWKHSFSIPIECGKRQIHDNPDLELWSNPHVTKLQTGNNRRIVCGGLMWDIYIHPNQGENGNEFALSVFPVKSCADDKLPENYKLKYTVSTSLSPQGHIDDDQKAVSRFDHAWNREIDDIAYDADVSEMASSKRMQQQIDWRSTMERLAFSTSDLLQYNCDEDNDYFNLYVSISTQFIKKQTKRSLYVGVLGAILV